MRLSELMHTRVVTIDSGEGAGSAWSKMRKNRIRHLVVTESGSLAGVISERDLGGRGGDEIRTGRTVGALMSSRVVSAEPTTTLREAANLMRGRLIGSLPVLDGDCLVGIVTATDVLDALGRGSSRPTRRLESRALRVTKGRRRAARQPVVLRRAPDSGFGRARRRNLTVRDDRPLRDRCQGRPSGRPPRSLSRFLHIFARWGTNSGLTISPISGASWGHDSVSSRARLSASVSARRMRTARGAASIANAE